MRFEREEYGEQRGVEYTVDADGFVMVDGKRALGAAGKPIRERTTVHVTCQRCWRSHVPCALWLYHRHEPAIDRSMFWFGLRDRVTHKTVCTDCAAKRAA